MTLWPLRISPDDDCRFSQVNHFHLLSLSRPSAYKRLLERHVLELLGAQTES